MMIKRSILLFLTFNLEISLRLLSLITLERFAISYKMNDHKALSFLVVTNLTLRTLFDLRAFILPTKLLTTY